MFSSLKIYAIIGIGVAVMIAGFYWYYRDSQAKIAQLISDNAKLEAAVQIQEQTIRQQQEDMRKQSEALREANSKFEAANQLAQRLQEKLNKHDIGTLAENRPGAVEDVVNRATRNVGRCFEILSGSPLTEAEKNATKKSEINNECPEIANPNYVPAP